MEPDLKELLERLSEANEALSQAFIRQSLAMNSVMTALREQREGHPSLFDQKDI